MKRTEPHRIGFAIALALGCSLAACGGGATPRPQSPADQPAPPATPAPAAAPRSLPPAVAGIPEPPAECNGFATNASATECATEDAERLHVLDAALSADGPERDGRLATLEACFSPGLIRALRAELAPVSCGDAIVGPYLEGAPAELTASVRHVLLGLGLGARLSRLVAAAPEFTPPRTKERFAEFAKAQLWPWVAREAHAVHQTALEGAKLLDYGKGVVAVQAGLADMRFVELSRAVPLPDEFAADPELKDAYYGALDQELEPRKTRGRDAALAALREFARVGALNDDRITRARALLATIFAGSRVDALDELLLPALPPLAADSADVRLAARLPTFYSSEILLSGADFTQPAALRALLERGLPPTLRQKLDATQTPETARLYARGLFGLGQRYWSAADFTRAADVCATFSKDARLGPEARLISALSRVLSRGPASARDLMVRGPILPDALSRVSELDDLAKGNGPISGMAAFNAAHLLSIIPQTAPDPGYWRAISERFKIAAKLLETPQQRAAAKERAAQADEVAKTIAAETQAPNQPRPAPAAR